MNRKLFSLRGRADGLCLFEKCEFFAHHPPQSIRVLPDLNTARLCSDSKIFLYFGGKISRKNFHSKFNEMIQIFWKSSVFTIDKNYFIF